MTSALENSAVDELIVQAVRAHAAELADLKFLPKARYDRSIFPTIGQYDWLAGQVLYSLVRATKPREVVEFSTGSGYASTFTALALKNNGSGRLRTVDQNPVATDGARRWFARNDLLGVVEIHLGDCRRIVPPLIDGTVDLLFVDSLHSFRMAEWYLAEVVPRLRPDALVHIHDVMPPEARVRIHGGPEYEPEPLPPRQPVTFLIKRAIWLLLHGQWPDPRARPSPRELLPFDRLDVFPAATAGELSTIDGNYFEEAVLVRELLRDAEPSEFVYLHRLSAELDLSAPQHFADQDRIGRSDARGRALEWNDALWTRAGPLARVADRGRVHRLVSTLRRRYYGQ